MTRAKPGDPHCQDLLEEGAQLAIHDPKVMPRRLLAISSFLPVPLLMRSPSHAGSLEW